eukprot:CAMPEP_0198133262 /NCGR_PEP_ID=MMETSP1442-20131203/59473_1 /TAXON_ID= /ORGANISM="Craspedostauros australis, Strain CCMP3328" /LENGTH=120 /DNA_ID=CAMNT_0043794375 /DNA_START=436 /DNA_END=798 /DNA_ORIENTATION=+
MIFRVSALARQRAQLLARRTFASEVAASKPAAGGGALNALARGWYNVFGKSTARYSVFLVVGCVVAEFGTNSLTDQLWEMNNAGKTYQQVDWSKFDPEDEDEDDDDDDEDDDEDDDDDDE